jgi:hypothetical protein
MYRFAAVLAIVTLALASTASRADEKKLKIKDLPQAVVDAVKAKFPDAELVKASTEKEDGKVQYEVGIKNKGQKIDVTLTEDGKITELEKTIKVEDLPKAVSDALAEKYPGATCKKAEEIVKVSDGNEKLQAYELVITTGDKKLEVTFGPEGKFVKEEGKK